MSPYSGYGPAQAIRDTSTSLADIIKDFAGIKLREAQLGLESKKIDLETEKVVGAGKKEIALADLAAATEQKQIRFQGQQLTEASRHNIAAEGLQGQQLSETTRSNRAREGILGRDLAIKEREEQRLNAVLPWEDLIKKSAMDPRYKEIMLKYTPEELRGQKVTVRDFGQFMEGFLKEHPKATAIGTLSMLEAAVTKLEAQAAQVKTPEEGEAIAQKHAEAVSYLSFMHGALDKMPGGHLTDKQLAIASDTAKKLMDANQEYPGGYAAAFADTSKAIADYNKSVYNDQITGKTVQDSIQKALGKNKPFDAQEQAARMKGTTPAQRKVALTFLKEKLKPEEYQAVENLVTGKLKSTVSDPAKPKTNSLKESTTSFVEPPGSVSQGLRDAAQYDPVASLSEHMKRRRAEEEEKFRERQSRGSR